MKRFEVKKMGVVSLFKVTLYMMLLPSVLFFMAGIVLALVGIVIQEREMIILGAVFGVLYPVLFLGLYSVMSMLTGVIYNFFAARFGGMELTLEEKDLSVPVPPVTEMQTILPAQTPTDLPDDTNADSMADQ